MRIEQSILQQLLSFSGKQGGGHRWFVDPVPRNSEHGVRWQKRTAEEDWISYANRLHSDAPKLGVVRGVSSLGIRCPKIELTAESKVRTWRILSVPKDWLEAQVKQALTEVGLQAVQPLNKRPSGRHTCAWTVSAMTAPNIDFYEIATDKATIVATLLQSRPKAHAREVLPSERTVRFKAFKQPAINGTVDLTDDMDTTEPPPEAAEADQSDGKHTESGKAKREATAQSASAKAKAQRTEKLPDGFTRRSNAGQGNCVFLAFSQAMEHLKIGSGRKKSAIQIRASTVAHLTKHASRYSQFWDGKKPDRTDSNLGEGTTFSDYLKALAAPGAWAGDLEIAAIAAHYDLCVIVYKAVAPTQQIFNRTGTAGTVALWYDGGHYEWLEGTVPAEDIDRASPAGWCGNRGGGRSCASSRSCSGVTQSAALPPRAASSMTRATALPRASSVRTKIDALPPGSEVSVADSMHQPALPQRFAEHVDSRKRRRQEQPGLATTRQCLCGWENARESVCR